MDGASDCLEAAVLIAERLDLPRSAPAVLYEGSSIIVRLAPGGPVARVGGLTARTRDLVGHYTREVAVARWLTECGAPVIGPWPAAPGPFTVDRWVLSLWREARIGEPATAEAIGPALRSCHTALRSLPRADGLPPVSALISEAQAITEVVPLARADRRRLDRALAGAKALLEDSALPVQPLHGDAGLGNVLTGAIWHDWEDSCCGPVVWDLASVVSTARILGRKRDRAERALAAYGEAPGLARLDEFVAARGAQVLAWSLLASAEEGRMRESTRARLRWLRADPRFDA